MKAVISTTLDPKYLFYAPIAAYCWKKLGIDTILIVSMQENQKLQASDMLALQTTKEVGQVGLHPYFVHSPAGKGKEATYAQVARLYAFLLVHSFTEAVVTSDIDMATFDAEYWKSMDNGCINLIGTDLTPENQYPMCYVVAMKGHWHLLMDTMPVDQDTGQMLEPIVYLQRIMDKIFENEECENMRGNLWCRDQETLYNAIQMLKAEDIDKDVPVREYARAMSPTQQFATKRWDRDGWAQIPPDGIIDAHLPRPGYEMNNFIKIVELLQNKYPEDSFNWLLTYRNLYVNYIANEGRATHNG